MLDPDAFPGVEVATLYHERWELELGSESASSHHFGSIG